ncbi:uncharacterized protein [Magallana gigas]|uniref:uncharacterized protein n=1 Tax=Magallana gigas TaxID=29159 RepID=UPI0033424B24
MLKSITLENFVHFKDRTVIDFDTTPRVKQSKASLHKEATSSYTSENKKQRRDAEKEVASGWNTLNIFVGANFCGKSTVIELIRRCMTDEINVSVTNSFDNNLFAYVFCQFNLSPYDEVISGIIKEPGNDVMYKVFIYSAKNDTFLRSKSSESIATYNGLVHGADDKEAIHSIVEKESVNIIQLLHLIKSSNPQKDCLPEEPSWKTIENKYVSTLPLRGIGMVQWTRSEKIKKEYKESNYRMACERAEVISTLLSEGHRDDVDEQLEGEIFRFITYPEIFKFIKKDGLLYVQHNESEFPLLKTSEGILEAKLTSLLLAHKHIQTLCLEDPDRGMHPQMIERLKTMMYMHVTSYKKTIIVVTHSPYFIDTITIDKTHVFFRKKTASNSYECSVKNAGKNKKLSKVSDIETLRTLLFSTKVLLVEGPIDKEVVQGLFTQYKCNLLERGAIGMNELYKDITTYQIIPVGGCENTKKIQSFCYFINLPCLCLWDLDKVVKFDKQTCKIQDFLEIGNVSKDKLKAKYFDKELSYLIGCDEDFETISTSLEQRKMFVWRHGTVEDAILSSRNRYEEICSSINCPSLTNKSLKKKLKERLDEEERKTFYSQLMEVSEIQRFIRFMEKEENERFNN